MSQVATGRRYSVAEFEKLPDTKGRELVDGRVVEKPMGLETSSVNLNFSTALLLHVRAGRLGHAFDSEGAYELFPGARLVVRKPDVSFVRGGRFPDDKPPKGVAQLAPDLAFESVSPHDRAARLQRKIDEYLAAGVRLVWVAYPELRMVIEYRPGDHPRRYNAADTLTADDVLPGFALPVADLFAGL